jgi:GDP-L-fucose synthase
MKILVTGGTGLVGYSIQKLVRKNSDSNQYIFWGSRDCNLVDLQDVLHKISTTRPDIIVHLGANVGGLFKNIDNNVQMFEDNLNINLNIITASKKYGVKLVLSCLSTCIFPDGIKYPITEEQLHQGAPHYSNNGYAYAKRILDIYTGLMNIDDKETNPLFVNLVPTNIYGENDNYNLSNSHVIPALIHRAYLCSLSEDTFEIKGSGSPMRMFIHSDDFARIIIDFISFFEKDRLDKMKKLIDISRENQKNYNFIIADSEEKEITIRDIAIKISQNFNLSFDKIVFNTSFSDGQYRKPVSNSRLLALYEKYETVLHFSNFEEKLEDTCKYFQDNFENIRR